MKMRSLFHRQNNLSTQIKLFTNQVHFEGKIQSCLVLDTVRDSEIKSLNISVL